MAELKTKQTEASVESFIRDFADTEQKRVDGFQLLELMKEVTGFEPKMWGPTMIGFGSYHYKSDRSKQEGDWPLVGFSPRKAAISLYAYALTEEHAACLSRLGKFKMGIGCIYIKRLSDVDVDALRGLIVATVKFLNTKYPSGE
jgi:hypothetical protein